MKYIFTIEVETDDIIGAKEKIAYELENVGSVRVTSVKEVKDNGG